MGECRGAVATLPLSLQSVLSLYPDLEQAPDDIERCDYALGERERKGSFSLSTLYIYYNRILNKIQIFKNIIIQLSLYNT